MLILPAETIKKIDENRGDMGQAEFIDFLIDSHFQQMEPTDGHYVSREQFQAFEQGMKDLFRSFLDFFLSFGLEIDQDSRTAEYEEFNHKLQGLEKKLDTGKSERRANIKWK
jgi:hypothetical protein